MWFWPDDPGTFNIRCAEYCGLDHSKMIGNVDVVAPVQNGLDICDADPGVQKVGGSN